MRKHNFYAGPSTLPFSVLEELRDQMVDFHGMGLSLVETSHRSKEYDAIHHEAMDGIRSLLGVPDGYKILFVGGGATLQFAMVPMNLMLPGGSADYVMSGSWAEKAIADARLIGSTRTVFDGSADGFSTLPEPETISPSEGSSYLHITSNETIGGIQWKRFPETGTVPMVADMSSDIMSRKIDVGKFGLIFAGAQKNLGPAGVTIVIVREDLLDRAPESLPAYLAYRTHADSDSLYNTPPVFSIYALRLVLQWIIDQGGVGGIEKRNGEKATLIYDRIDGNDGFYRCPIDIRYRSTMNVVFRLPNEELEQEFVAEAKEHDMIGLKGHRSVGGIRASLYNALPLASARVLADFMDDFASRKG